MARTTTNKLHNQSINQSINLYRAEARATVRLCRIEEKCLETDLKCVNGWSSPDKMSRYDRGRTQNFLLEGSTWRKVTA